MCVESLFVSLLRQPNVNLVAKIFVCVYRQMKELAIGVCV